MKMRVITSLAFATFLTLSSCGDDKEKSTDEAKKDEKKETSIEVSEDMEHFMSHLDGNYESVEHALEEFAGNDDIANHDMGMYDLREPVVLGKDGDCYDVECKSGQVKNRYNICWQDGKIVSITGG